MGWETRKGKSYYYRKQRTPEGRVRSIYCGGGERGLRAEDEDERARREATQLNTGAPTEAPSLKNEPAQKLATTQKTFSPLAAYRKRLEAHREELEAQARMARLLSYTPTYSS